MIITWFKPKEDDGARIEKIFTGLIIKFHVRNNQELVFVGPLLFEREFAVSLS